MLKIYSLLISLCFFVSLSAQQKYPQSYFRPPVDFKMLLSGTFGELRADHFHSGIDIKTEGVSGKKVHAVADGYIARISVSGTGFGKALYMVHPNGYTSVYGHLSKFAEPIDKYVRSEQYKREQFKVTLYPPKEMFVINKGDVIALSGNSGGSDGPHLHFEIRDSGSEIPINPLLFGFKVKDLIRPKITGFRLYPMEANSEVMGKNEDRDLKVEGWGLNYRIGKNDTINVSGKIGFGIQAHDLLNDSNNKNGVYSIEFKIDSNLIYSHHLEKFSFNESKYINSLIDYAEYVGSKKRYQRTIIDPGNRLNIYDIVENQGTFNFSDSLFHPFVFELKDAQGNTSRLSGVLKSSPVKDHIIQTIVTENWFDFDTENEFKTENIELHFDKGSFYRSFEFCYDSSIAPPEAYSDLHKIHQKSFPVHRPYDVKIKTLNLPENFEQKALIAKMEDGKIGAVGGSYKDGFVVGKLGSFGDYLIVVDTIAPEIKALNIHDGKKISGYKRISFEVKDELSGIGSFRGTLNGKWILLDDDPKNNRLTYQIDERMNKGINHLRLEVKDNKDNLAVFEADIEY